MSVIKKNYCISPKFSSLCHHDFFSHRIYHAQRPPRLHHTGTPLTLTSSIKSSVYSIFPLFTTAISAQFPVFGTLLLSRSLFHLSGLQSELNLLIPPVLTIGFVILQQSWGLAYAVAVVESKWGFRAWKRSFDLTMMMMKKKKKEEEDPRNTGLGNYYCRLILVDGFNMGLMVSGMLLLPDDRDPSYWLLVLIPYLIAPGLFLTLLNNTMSFAVLYMMSLSLSLPVDEIENQVQAPLLVSVC